MKKLYEKSEIWFAVAWIIAYVVLASTGDNISADLGIDKIVTLPILIAMSVILYFFVRKNGLTEKYGFCKPQLPAVKILPTSLPKPKRHRKLHGDENELALTE